jgi:hypothetical protein
VRAVRKLQRYLFGTTDPEPVGGAGPRGFVGGLWHELGELQFKFLVDHGLRPEHVLLDVACGSLRAGARLIPYLNAGNYLGIDIDGALIEHGKTIEIGETLCKIKTPRASYFRKFRVHKILKAPGFCYSSVSFHPFNH